MLRLFPLARVVLFPGQPLTLQVFEPRYRQLIAECVQEQEPFGVVLIREGVEVDGPAVPQSIGTTARLTGFASRQDGTLQVSAVGVRRFRIIRLDTSAPYLQAEVETVLDEFAEVNSEVLRFARSALQRIAQLEAIGAGEFRRDYSIPKAAGAVADAVAGRAEADVQKRQQILETTNVKERLDLVLPLVEQAVGRARTTAARAVHSRWAAFGMAN